MSGSSRNLVVSEDMIIKGQVRNCGQIDVFGLVEGEIYAEMVVIHPGGRFLGMAKVHAADIRGQFEGRALIKNLMHIRETGNVIGDVRYGRLAVEPGGNLSGDLKNVPPEIFGDLTVEVAQGKAVTVTTQDLNGFDPDDGADSLVFSVLKTESGIVRLAGASSPVKTFSQQDLVSGRVQFVHDGSRSGRAGFDVVLTDAQGATSGAPITVDVVVTA